MGKEVVGRGHGADRERPSQGGGAREAGPVAVARHLHRAVAQLDGLVDALHDLVETCGGREGSRHGLPLPTPHAHGEEAPGCEDSQRPESGADTFPVKGWALKILGFVDPEAKLRTLCRCMSQRFH